MLAGNAACMEENGIAYRPCHMMGTTIHVAIDGEYEGHIVISDTVKPDAKEAPLRLKAPGRAQNRDADGRQRGGCGGGRGGDR